MKSIESQAEEYAEALNDIADVLGMPTGSTSAQIAEGVESRWADGIHSCGATCKRTACVLRRERDQLAAALEEMRYGHTDKAESMAIAALAYLENAE